MESLHDLNCCSLSDNYSLYERYMKTFKVGGNLLENISNRVLCISSSLDTQDITASRSNTDLIEVQSALINKHCETADSKCDPGICDNYVEKGSSLDTDLCTKVDSPCNSVATLSRENSVTTLLSLAQEKSNHIDTHVSSEESSIGSKQPVFITPTMENSNNAVDSVPLFSHVSSSEIVFKLPISELSFNGTIKHIQKLKPIVDPITALSSTGLENNEKHKEIFKSVNENDDSKNDINKNSKDLCESNIAMRLSSSSRDSQHIELNTHKEDYDEGTGSKWNSDQSSTSFDASYDSGIRSPDMFSDNDDDNDNNDEKLVETEPFWNFLKDYELYEKKKVKKCEENLQGLPPPTSLINIKEDVTEMLNKYYNFLPHFNETPREDALEVNSMTPKKRVSFIEIPEHVIQSKASLSHATEEGMCSSSNSSMTQNKESVNKDCDAEAYLKHKIIDLNVASEAEVMETSWPHILKCKYHDVYYNVTKYSEKYEFLALQYGSRFVGAETDTSVNIYSGGKQSPSSASKRKAIRLKQAQATSPGSRLSYLARRRQAFCTAATIHEKAYTSSSKMFLIDKKKTISNTERKSPRLRRTPGKKTPTRRTPGKKTPAKTPKTGHGSSSKKKAMRRLLMDSESLSRTQPTRETLKRALFISPENKKNNTASQSLLSSENRFGSSFKPIDTQSCDGIHSQGFKRKLSSLDHNPEYSKSKIVKSLSFGGDIISGTQNAALNRRSSEGQNSSSSSDFYKTSKQKLFWAASEALRAQGWRLTTPGFREKASSLATLITRLIGLPQHAARLAATTGSSSQILLKLARKYVFEICQGHTVEECYKDEQVRLAKEATLKPSSYYHQMKLSQLSNCNLTSNEINQIKENRCSDASIRLDQPKFANKNVLQDKLINIDANSNSSSGLSGLDKQSLILYKSSSMPSFEEAAKLRVRRQISFDNANIPKR